MLQLFAVAVINPEIGYWVLTLMLAVLVNSFQLWMSTLLEIYTRFPQHECECFDKPLPQKL